MAAKVKEPSCITSVTDAYEWRLGSVRKLFWRFAIGMQAGCRKAQASRSLSYYRKLWIWLGMKKATYPICVGHAKPGESQVEGDATDAEGGGEWGFKGSRRGAF
jgi:hypothetical protein